jgi:transcriptional regulator with XRE-family HTH domain
VSTENARSFGADLRAIRRTRGRTLQVLADQLGRSVGWLSQVERDLSQPSLTDLRQIAEALDVPVSTLLRHESTRSDEAGLIVRADARRPIGARMDGLVEELLSPDLTDDFEMVHSCFAPHAHSAGEVQRPTQEVGVLIAGQLDLTIDGRAFSLQPGDSFRIRGEAFSWSNPHDSPAIAVWVIAPPVY